MRKMSCEFLKNKMMLLAAALLALAMTAAGNRACAEKEKENGKKDRDGQGGVFGFGKAAVGALPAGWRVAETQGKGTPAAWRVVPSNPANPKSDHVVAITSTTNTGGTYNLLLAEGSDFKTGSLKLKTTLKALGGKEDQGGGLLWGARDENNYYVTRWNPLETNLRIYTVKDGKRTQLASLDGVTADPQGWHTLEVEHEGNEIEVKLDERKIEISVQDGLLGESGMIGLWTKADAATAFGPVKVTTGGEDDEDEDNEKDGKDRKEKKDRDRGDERKKDERKQDKDRDEN